MKNKLLVLTLAFAMMLSFMPMASFATSEHDDTHFTDEIYIWDDDADCEQVDNEYHRVTGTGEVEVWCEDCKMVVDSYEIEADGKKFFHDYDEEGYCETCDYHCTHLPEKLAEEYYWEEGEGEGKATCTPVNGKFHEVTGSGEKEIYCEYCEKTFSIEPYVFNGDLFSHEYDEEGNCDLCGYTNDCPHDPDNWEEAYIWDDETVFISKDNESHIVTGTAEVEVWCGDCGMVLSSGESRIFEEEEFPHEYDENGYCDLCGHTNDCPHVHQSVEYWWEEGDATCTPVDDEFHSVTGTGEKEIYCKDCWMTLSIDPYEFKGDLLPHIYNDKGVCEDCGHNSSLDERICGSSRYDTAILVADKIKAETGEKFANIIVADGGNYPDALSGGYLAWVKDAPILLVRSRPTEENQIASYIRDNLEDGGTVYLLGGTGAVSASFEDKLKQSGIFPVRLGGINRYETNLKILKEAGVDGEDLLVCTGNGYADSLSASAARMPILLVGSTLTDDQKNYIRGLNTDQFYLIGGEGAVKPKIKSDLIDLGYSEDSIERIAGSTRYETSTKVADTFFPEPDTVVLAFAKNFPDGLSGGPLALSENAPIILADSNNKNIQAAKEYVAKVKASRSITLGGTTLISDAAVKTIMGR